MIVNYDAIALVHHRDQTIQTFLRCLPSSGILKVDNRHSRFRKHVIALARRELLFLSS